MSLYRINLLLIILYASCSKGLIAETIEHDDKTQTVKAIEIDTAGHIIVDSNADSNKDTLYKWHTNLLWESRYVTEGRDNLSGDGLVSISTDFSVNTFSIIPWFAYSPESDYSELNLNLVYSRGLTDKLSYYVAYNHIQTRQNYDENNDNEFSLELAYNWSDQLLVLADAYHSFDTNGSFIELATRYGHSINQRTRLSIVGTLGLNAGYVPDGHTGANHFQLRVHAAYNPSSQIELYAYLGYNIAIDRDNERYAGDETLQDFLWGATGFTYLF